MADGEDEEAAEETAGDDMAIGTLATVARAAENAGVFKALLGPASKVIGDYWGRKAQDWVDGLEAKRNENLQIHYERVKTIEHIEPPENGPTERQVEALVGWTEGAKTVDPKGEPELAAMWQSLLSEIYRNDEDVEEQIAILSQMTRADARTFLTLRKRPPVTPASLLAVRIATQVPEPHRERFLRWGLIQKTDALRTLRIIIPMFALIFPFALLLMLPDEFLLVMGILNFVGPIRGFAILLGSIALMYGILRALHTVSATRLTPLGRKMLTSGRKFYKVPEDMVQDEDDE